MEARLGLGKKIMIEQNWIEQNQGGLAYNGFMFSTGELLGLSVSSGMNIKIICNFYLPEQESPGMINL